MTAKIRITDNQISVLKSLMVIFSSSIISDLDIFMDVVLDDDITLEIVCRTEKPIENGLYVLSSQQDDNGDYMCYDFVPLDLIHTHIKTIDGITYWIYNDD